MGAEVEVHNIMSIPGRGAVLLARVQSGSVQVGQLSVPIPLGKDVPQRLEVASIERLSSMEGRGAAVGIGFRNDPHPEYLRRRFPVGSILSLSDPESRPSPQRE